MAEEDTPIDLANLYVKMRYAMGGVPSFSETEHADKLTHDALRLVAAGYALDVKLTFEQWDELGFQLHLYLGTDGVA